MAGLYLYRYFSQYQGLNDAKRNGEIQVLCPFPHSKGKETRPSASINIDKGLFKCFTCQAEGRFNNGGMTETEFVSHVHSISYEEAVTFIRNITLEDDSSWERATTLLFENQHLVDYLAGRGITEEMIHEYRLGFTGDGIRYPIIVNGVCVDTRTYTPDAPPDTPKMRSKKGAKAMLYPYDQFKEQLEREPDKPIIFNAGENDTLLMRKVGFNAVTSTLGEGSIPKMFMKQFKDRDVIVLYDGDSAGKLAAVRIAFFLHDEGARVRIADITLAGLTGEKDDKDVTDFFIKHEGTVQQLEELVLNTAVEFDEEMAAEVREQEYPLKDLWEVLDGKYYGKRLTSRAMMSGKIGKKLYVPSLIEAQCHSPILDSEKSCCHGCPLSGTQPEFWTLSDKGLNHVIPLADAIQERKESYVKGEVFGIPQRCPKRYSNVFKEVRQRSVQQVILTPDVETETGIIGFQETQVFGYVIQDEEGNLMENGGRYRAYFKPYAHYRDQSANLVIDRFENSDNSLNTFAVTDELVEKLSQFQGTPDEVMAKRFDLGKQVVGSHAHPLIVYSLELTYHSVLDMEFFGREEKGHPEILIVGATRSGKTSSAEAYLKFYGMGNITSLKQATEAGLVGGNDRPMSGGNFQITWGAIPKNNGGLLLLDELSGMNMNIFAKLTSLRSKRVAEIEKIASGKAQAKTRLLWLSNARVGNDGKSRNLRDYANGVDIAQDLVGSYEDISRFDAICLIPAPDEILIPEKKPELDDDAYRQLIRWAWTRKAENVMFAHNVERYIWTEAQRLNKQFHARNDLNLLGTEADKKLARIAISVAVMCFSHDGTGENVLVAKEHVDWAVKFLNMCYDNDIFKLKQYVESELLINETTEAVNTKVAEMIRTHYMVLKTLSAQNECTIFQLQAISGLTKDDFNTMMNTLARMNLVQVTSKGVYPTGRFRKAVAHYRQHYAKREGLVPLAQQGGNTI